MVNINKHCTSLISVEPFGTALSRKRLVDWPTTATCNSFRRAKITKDFFYWMLFSLKCGLAQRSNTANVTVLKKKALCPFGAALRDYFPSQQRLGLEQTATCCLNALCHLSHSLRLLCLLTNSKNHGTISWDKIRSPRCVSKISPGLSGECAVAVYWGAVDGFCLN